MSNKEVQKYNDGNLSKYQSKNLLKRRMLSGFHNRLRLVFKDIIGDNHKMRILDAGCGEGFISYLLMKEYPSVCITGIDGADEALEYARKLVPEGHFEKENIYELPYEDKEFDLVICCEVFEHLHEPKDALRELQRVGKRLLITVPNEPWFRMGNMLSLKNVTRFGDPIDHINHWTFAGFKRFIIDNIDNPVVHFDKAFPWSIYWG